MEQTSISTTRAPAAIGPYSQAIRYGQFIYASGQIALDPASGELAGSDIETQTHRVFQNIQAVLEAAQTDLAHVVKTTVFLTSMSDFAAMNAVYAGYFESTGRPAPARSTIAVAALPRNALVEIECVAFVEA
ncbi:MAG TPA: RidA family protein [Ktedonobacteraceae bacterium]|nr:RidA family protein [Ktedonobacteraceae bacterium]